MINKVGAAIKPRTILNAASTSKPDRMTRFMQSKALAKICEIGSENPVLEQSLFSLGICLAIRPLTNYAITPDKKDAAYSSGHSIASGIVGTVWPLVVVTPITATVAKVFKRPQKFLKAEAIKKFYPLVGIKESVGKDGKKVLEVMTNTKGELISQDGKLLNQNVKALVIKGGDAAGELKDTNEKIERYKKIKDKFKISFIGKRMDSKIAKLEESKVELQAKHEDFLVRKQEFEDANKTLYVDNVGVVRSRIVPKTKDGKFQYDKNNKKVGCYVLEDKTPVTEEMERGFNKCENTKDILKWGTDILLAIPRSMLTIKCIPPILGLLGLEKSKKPQPTVNNNTYKQFKGMGNYKALVNANKNVKGGV